MENKEVIVKQNIILKIAAYINLLASVFLLFFTLGNVFNMIKIGNFEFSSIVTILIGLVLIFYTFVMNNFNLGKSIIYDNKVIFIILLCLNFIFACFYAVYFIVFILSLIGFIKSIKSKTLD